MNLEQLLTKLGLMRKKRAKTDFKSALRTKLSERASELQGGASSRWNLNWNGGFKRWAPAVSGALLLLIVLQVVIGPRGVVDLSIELVNVAEAQEYYTLTPSESDDSGVDSLASFTLESKGDLNAKDLSDVIRLTPEMEFKVEQVDKNTVNIIPEAPLDAGSLVQVELAAQNLEDAPYKKTFRWAYSVSEAFRVTGTNPGNKMTGAPINTVLSISFSHYGVEASDVEAQFQISPEVKGEFSIKDKELTFIPDEVLLEDTIYTVTLGAELPLGDTEQTLGEDYVWTFETGSDVDQNASLNVERFVTMAPGEDSLIPVYAYNGQTEEDAVDYRVYAYEDYEEYLTAIQGYRSSVPAWATAANQRYQVPVASLSKIMEGTEHALIEQDYRTYLDFPQALEEGYYLVEVDYYDASTQSFVQVTPTATFMALSDVESLFWVNDVESGKPVQGASIQFLNRDEELKTDSDGVASLSELYQDEDFEEEETLLWQIEVDRDGEKSFYELSYNNYDYRLNERAWTLFETDRRTYRPDDTLRFWGMVQGREAPIQGEAELFIDGANEPISLTLEDGRLFSGEVELVEMSTGYHSVELRMGEDVLLYDYVYVENFALPAYEVTLSAERSTYFVGETVTVDIDARFFEGTPLAHTELRVMKPNGTEEIVTTDAEGKAQSSWKATARMEDCDEYCSLSYYDGLIVRPVQEELALIEGSHYFDIYRSDIAVDPLSRPTHDGWDFVAYEVDVKNTENTITDVVAQHGQISYRIEQEQIRTYTEEYFDEIDQVVRQETRTESSWTELSSGSVTRDAQGVYHLDYDLDESKNHRIFLEVDDGTAGIYRTNAYLSKAFEGNETPYLYLESVDAPEEGYSIGDTVMLQTYANDSVVDTEEDRFLFYHSQEGLQSYALEDTGLYEFEFEAKDVPNLYVNAVRFDGSSYQMTGYKSIFFNSEDRRFDLEVSVDKESYAPGDEITVTVESEREAGIQIQLVDEAYYSLYDEDLVNPLTDLYAALDSDVDAVLLSHKKEEIGGDKGGCFVAGTLILMADGSHKAIEDVRVGDQILTREHERSDTLVPATVASLHRETVRETLLVNGSFGLTDNHVIFLNGRWTEAKKMKVGDTLLNEKGEWVLVESITKVQDTRQVYNFEVENKHSYFADGHYVHNDKSEDMRAEFPITAFFGVVEAGSESFVSDGRAEVSFTLPDSITEWRVSVAAVAPGEEIYAGYGTASAKVSLPAFVQPVLNTQYLEGDEPQIPVRAYGDELEQGESVEYWMESESLGLGTTLEGRAFESSYFELEALPAGNHSFQFGMESEAGSDAVELHTEVYESYFRQPLVEETILQEGISLPGSENSRTWVAFLNNENGPIYNTLQWALWQDGERVDEAVGRSLAAEWLMEVFDQDEGEIEFHAGLYQNVEGEGGISLFPYSDPSLEVSAQVAALAPEKINQSAAARYFETTLYGEVTLLEKLQALYGLAGVDRNVLLEAHVFEREFEMNDEEKLWLALAYSEMGDGDAVTRLFLDIDARDFDGEALMLMATLADYVSSDQREELYKDALKAEDFNLLPSLLYSKQRLTHVNGDPVSFSLNGETIEIEAQDIEVRSFSSDTLDEIQISELKGDVLAISSYWDYVSPRSLATQDDLNIERWYSVNGERVDTLKSGDIVDVHLKLSLDPETGYLLVDYLPSGLQPLARPFRSWWMDVKGFFQNPITVEGQELQFYVYCDPGVSCADYEFVYQARVVNPGSFTAEPAFVQELKEEPGIGIGESQTIQITP